MHLANMISLRPPKLERKDPQTRGNFECGGMDNVIPRNVRGEIKKKLSLETVEEEEGEIPRAK